MPVSYVCDRCGFPVLRGPAGWVHASAGDAAFCAAFAGVSLTPSADLPACRDEADCCISCGAEIDHYLGCPDDPNPDYEAEAELPERNSL